MTDQTTRQDLEERIGQIESMLLEGRRGTQRYGWTMVLWGTAYLIATGWSLWSNRPLLAWSVTMTVAVCLSVVIGKKKARAKGGATSIAGRAMCALWVSIGTALFVFSFSVSISGHWEIHSFMAGIEALLGAAYLATGIFLRFKLYLVLGILWWAGAVASCFVPLPQVGWIFLGLTVFLIGSGVYLMILESRWANAPQRPAHV